MDRDPSQLSKETEQLMKVRRDFADLKKDEEKYLHDREVKAQALLKDIHKQIGDAEKMLGSVQDKILQRLKDFGENVDTLLRGLSSMLDRTEATVEKSDGIIKKSEKASDILKGAFEHVTKLTGKMSEFEKDLKEKEVKINKKNKDADKKLEEAENLAYWHKEGKTYKGKSKK